MIIVSKWLLYGGEFELRFDSILLHDIVQSLELCLPYKR
jgi:hypothetical protein